MLRIRQTGYAESHAPKHLQRPLIDRDAFARQEAEGIVAPEVPIVETHIVEVPTGAFRVRLFAPHRDRPLPLLGDHLVDLPLSRVESMGADAAKVSEST